ncbi:TerB family tellurite resistance protein [Polaribacter sp. IC073]|uniref:TerB family tellurite resistance protein n=1 Tax=Polaribacter sp. IC073 TaxID=2508540 RepID=UPI0011BD976B|nr:TerB family tellurite resistance protein [Polaribacter sp. IC073]TXD49953.1 TerB family tellurite resistance protein [Polaribacter sp. IC073]
MAISDLYTSGQHKQEIGHFANIVKIAKADGEISEIEKELLIRAGKNLNITLEESILILTSPEKYPTNPPVSYDDRIERLYRLTRMIMADGEAKLVEVKMMQKIAVGLHFSVDNAEKVCDEAIYLVKNNNDLADFTAAIRKVDRA